MLAAVFEGEGRLILQEVPVPELERDDQVLLKVDAVSICGTDVHIVEVPPAYSAGQNIILGHEFVGTVVRKGAEVTHLDIGDRAVVNPKEYCGVCTYCRKNLRNACKNTGALGIHFDGAFAEYCRASANVAYCISKGVPVEQAACAEPLACVINGTRKLCVQPGESTLVIGAGPVGLIMAMVFKTSGAAKVIIAEKAPYRIDHARKMEIGRVVDVGAEDLKDVIEAETEVGVDIAADATGSQLPAAVECARRGGRVLVVGVNTQAVTQFHQCDITIKELQVLGTWAATAAFPDAVNVLEAGLLDIGGLITDVIPLSDIHQGLGKLMRGEAVKVIIKP